MEGESKIIVIVLLGFLIMSCVILIIMVTASTNRKRQLIRESKIQNLEHEKKELEYEKRELEHQRQIENFRLINETEEQEKEKIAKNLHDGILPVLSTTFRSLDKNAVDFGKKTFDLDRLKKDIRIIGEAITDLRGVSHNLVPPYLLSNGLILTLENFVSQMNVGDQTEAIFTNNTAFSKDLPFTMPEQLNMYRVCLELLNNVIKHGHYEFLSVTVEIEGNALAIDVIHDGKIVTNSEIMELTQTSNGLGLKSIQSRLLILNATIDYSEQAEAAKISLCFPIKN
jgi:two-component system, NarL family, sensor kinase